MSAVSRACPRGSVEPAPACAADHASSGAPSARAAPAAGACRRFALPNGLVIAGINRLDTRVLFHEVFESDLYWRHGIRLQPGDTVFDVGANIGMYSLFLDQRFPGLRIHAFEPIPQVFAALADNACLFRNSTMVAHPYGLSNHDGYEIFSFDRFLSYAGSSHLHELRKVLPRTVGGAQTGAFAPSRWVRAVLDELVMTGVAREGRAVRAVRRLLRSRLGRAVAVPGWLAVYALFVVRRSLFLSHVRGEVCTFSRVKRELGVATIDLLKIDVEGAELDVLRGVGEDDWTSIRQVIAEVHDVDGRLAACCELLEARGFSVVVEPEPRPVRRLLRISHVHARRA